MATLRLTFEVDNTALYNALAMVKGNTDLIGARVVRAMLDGDPSLSDAIGMNAYGITLANVEKVEREEAKDETAQE